MRNGNVFPHSPFWRPAKILGMRWKAQGFSIRIYKLKLWVDFTFLLRRLSFLLWRSTWFRVASRLKLEECVATPRSSILSTAQLHSILRIGPFILIDLDLLTIAQLGDSPWVQILDIKGCRAMHWVERSASLTSMHTNSPSRNWHMSHKSFVAHWIFANRGSFHGSASSPEADASFFWLLSFTTFFVVVPLLSIVSLTSKESARSSTCKWTAWYPPAAAAVEFTEASPSPATSPSASPWLLLLLESFPRFIRMAIIRRPLNPSDPTVWLRESSP